MTESSRLRVLAGEHLHDGVVSPAEFLEFFGHLLRASDDDAGVPETDVRVVCWLTPGSVHHHVAVRERRTGRLCSRLEFVIAMDVSPADLDRHANDLARVLTEALNPDCFPPLADEAGAG